MHIIYHVSEMKLNVWSQKSHIKWR